MDVTKEEIIGINKELGGDLVADGSIDYALHAGKGRSPYWRIALLWRAILSRLNKRAVHTVRD